MVAELFERPLPPLHPGPARRAFPDRAVKGQPMRAIPGNVPSIFDFPEGCRYASRCPVVEASAATTPNPTLVKAARRTTEVRCHLVVTDNPAPPWTPDAEASDESPCAPMRCPSST